MTHFICTLALLLGLTTWVYAQPVHMPDPNLRTAVRESLDLPNGAPITRDAMLQLIKLRPGSRGIENLSGVEFAKNLRELSIWGNPITDLSPIAGLTKLELLYMWGTPISDITPLANLANLINLRLNYCNVADISPVAHLLKLEKLSLAGNGITDVGPLANLTQLRLLNLENNGIVDVRPLAGLRRLETLTIEGNRITDHSPLDGLSLEHFTHDLETPCDMPPLAFGAAHRKQKLPILTHRLERPRQVGVIRFDFLLPAVRGSASSNRGRLRIPYGAPILGWTGKRTRRLLGAKPHYGVFARPFGYLE